MTTQLQLRRGNKQANDNFKGAEGELTYDTESKNLRIHDNVNYGGTVIARDADVMHKVNNMNENITGGKTFQGTIYYQDTGMNEATPPSANNPRIKDIYFIDGTASKNQLARFGLRQESSGMHSAEMVTQKHIAAGTSNLFKAFFKNNVDASGQCSLTYDCNVDGTGTATNLSMTKTATGSSETTVPTMGWVNRANSGTTYYNNVVHITGTETISGAKTFSGNNSFTGTNSFTQTVTAPTFSGTATRAEWADLAENYESDEKYPIGTLIKFGGEKDITIADKICNGIISDKPGFLLHSELENSLPVALVGKTKVRVIGKVKKFDNLVLSSIPGVAKVKENSDDKQVIIAKTLEESSDENEKLIMAVVKFNIF